MIIFLLLTGVAVSFISSFFGVGGGIVTIPVLYTLFPKMPPFMAIATSLGLIFLNSLLNTFRFIRLGKRPHGGIILSLGPGIVLGVLTGVYLALLLDAHLLKTLFAVVLLIVAIKVILSKPPQESREERLVFSMQKYSLGFLFSFLGGLIAGVSGLGGGVIIVPLLITVFAIAYRDIPFYSNMILAIGSLTGLIRYGLTVKPLVRLAIFKDLSISHQLGQISWILVLIFFLPSLFISPLGAKLSQKIAPKVTKRLYISLLLIFAGKIFLSL